VKPIVQGLGSRYGDGDLAGEGAIAGDSRAPPRGGDRLAPPENPHDFAPRANLGFEADVQGFGRLAAVTRADQFEFDPGAFFQTPGEGLLQSMGDRRGQAVAQADALSRAVAVSEQFATGSIGQYESERVAIAVPTINPD
jgi:hypothetical protein